VFKKRIYWLLALGWCLGIYFFTASPVSTGESSGTLLQTVLPLSPDAARELNYVIRKGAHLATFGLLGILLLQAFGGRKGAPIYAWALATLYGAADELHQGFVPGRTSLLSDVAIDSGGALAAILLFLWVRSRLRRKI
jgi:VanZ family protein